MVGLWDLVGHVRYERCDLANCREMHHTCMTHIEWTVDPSSLRGMKEPDDGGDATVLNVYGSEDGAWQRVRTGEGGS